MKKDIEKELREERVMEFEKKFGTELFLKTVLSAFSKVLVEKEIITEEELGNYFDERMFEVEKEYRKFQEKEEQKKEGNNS